MQKHTLESPTGNTPVIALPGAVTIENVETLAGKFRELNLAAGETLTLDVGHTDIITTPGIQLIIALAATLKAVGAAMTIRKPKDSFRQAFGVLGLAPQLAQWEKSV